ncbi:hypothetical protein FRC07_004071 [Ceratobasidium sp. 392]|nr:hypothetical protein FRC07_004071 [Ceratobasidium sp. 392]
MRDARTESSANAKFGTRLRESSIGGGERQESRASDRPGSRQTASRAAGKRVAEKPAWGAISSSNTAIGGGSATPSGRRGSATLAPSSGMTTPQQQRIAKTVAASPAPSVDSGIAVYLAQDSTTRLDRTNRIFPIPSPSSFLFDLVSVGSHITRSVLLAVPLF